MIGDQCQPVTGWISGATADGAFFANVSTPAPATPIAPMGNATSPGGDVITFDSVSLLENGRRWIPLMGEYQFSRSDPAKWDDDIRLAREGGLDTIGTYVFWIHHQEQSPNVTTQWDWSGAKSLRTFVQKVQAAGMKLFMRLGPWAHGECRNGGTPDWVLNIPGIKVRSNTTMFMSLVAELYSQIAAQLDGFLWKQGGPVIGAQVDNEYGGDYTYLLALKELALASGIDVPFYTKTGWPQEPMPSGMLLPFFGGYADGFWDRALTPQTSYEAVFFFSSIGEVGYPPLQVEIGGGMTTSYHRRIRMFSADICAAVTVQLGSGSNGLGYYIYHGGHQPLGVLSTLEEAQDATGYQDLPVRSYDFYAPIGEWSQLHAHYHCMRRLHGLVRIAGAALAGMPLTQPRRTPTGVYDLSTLRWSVRSDGRAGVVFINNHQRQWDCSQNCSLPDMANVSLTVALPSGTNLTLPSSATGAVNVPADAVMWWPFNWTVARGVAVAQATVSPFAALDLSAGAGTNVTLLAFAPRGVPAELITAPLGAGFTISACAGTCVQRGDGSVQATALTSGMTPALALVDASAGVALSLLLLDDDASLRAWA